MPCYYTGSAEGDARLSLKEAQKATTETTELLCSLCRVIENKGCFSELDMPDDVKLWWAKHKGVDKLVPKRKRK